MTAATGEPHTAKPAIDPFLAASLILIDRPAGGAMKILLGRRHANHVFLPGKFVFPGGRSEAEDAHMAVSGGLAAPVVQRLRQPAIGPAIEAPDALALTAIRELFEETGMLIGDVAASPVSAPPGTSWAQFAASGIIPNVTKLHYVARAQTPPGNPRRFDVHFFAADVSEVAATIDGSVHAEAELVELRWTTVREIAELDILPITLFIAMELAERQAAGLGHELPVPYFYMQDDRWIRAEL